LQKVYLSVIEILHELVASLLQRSDLGEGGLVGIGQFLDLLLELALGLLDFVELRQSFVFESCLPLLDFSVEFADLSGQLGLGFTFLIELFTEVVVLVFEVLDLSGKGLSLTGLLIQAALGFLELRGQGRLQTVKAVQLILEVFQLTAQVTVFVVQTVLECSEVRQLTGLLIAFGLDFRVLDFHLLEGLLHIGLGASLSISGGLGFFEVAHELGLLSISLGLQLLELLELVSQLSDGIVVLLAKGRQLGLVIQVLLLGVTAQLGEFSLTLLVGFELSSSSSTLFLQALADLFQLALKVGTSSVGLGARSALVLELVFEFGDSGLQLLDLLLELGNEGLFLLEFGAELVEISFLLAEVVLEVILLLGDLIDVLLSDLKTEILYFQGSFAIFF